MLLYELPRLLPSLGRHGLLHPALTILVQHPAQALVKQLSAALDAGLKIMVAEARVDRLLSCFPRCGCLSANEGE